MRKYSFKLLLLFFVIVGIENTAFTQKNLKKSRSKFKLGNIFGFGKMKDSTSIRLNQALEHVNKIQNSTTIIFGGSGTDGPYKDDDELTQLQEEINKASNTIEDLKNKLNQLNPFKKNDKEKLKAINEELTNLINKKIAPFVVLHKIMQNPKILSTDNSFKTGQAELNTNAKNNLYNFVNDFDFYIKQWLAYKDPENKTIYKSSQLIVRINIIGYADMQGKGSEAERMKYNQQLSEKRANNIKLQLKKEIAALREKYNLDIEYFTIGKGEELPIGVKDKELIDNPERRRVIITTAIFPEELIK
jgi:outer membrane protein OmpA-like peptidoglycan-associated protein